MMVYNGTRTVHYMSKAKRKNQLSPELIERIMLAVTEVNGCEMCSYAHAKMALEAGLSNEEIKEMLAGEHSSIPANEIQAIMFAQHYADSRGKPAEKSWNRIIDIYGQQKARDILGAIRIIMMGNAYGIPWGSFLKRFRRKPDTRSSIIYEAEVIILGSLLIPFAMIHSLIALLVRLPLLNF